jgi:N-acetylmuramic acid 6-phosphate etherase
MLATDVNYEEAEHYLKEAKGHVKSAILMSLTSLDLKGVQKLLNENDGFIKKALIEWRKTC